MKKKIIILIITIGLLAAFLYSQNNWIGVTRLQLEFDRLPREFDGFKIIHLSDLHGKLFGAGQKKLVEIINKSKPNMIVITGDLTDSRHYYEQPALELVKQAVKTAPVYFVAGNHECYSGKFGTFEAKLKEAGAVVLRNEWRVVNIHGQKIYMAGVDDPDSMMNMCESDYFNTTLSRIVSSMPEKSLKILLSHRPESFSQYSASGFDLIFSGHAHGGQFRLPFLGGMVAPDQGFFPKYTSGVYRDKASDMVVSRGLGNSIIPQRIFNRPEVVEVNLKREP